MKIFNIMTLFTALCTLIGCQSKGFETVDANQFARTIARPEVQLVDVRTAEEYADGHLPHAVNIDVTADDFATQITSLDKEQPVAIYCRSGRRSKQAAKQMSEAGYQVTELKGGIGSWQGEVVQ